MTDEPTDSENWTRSPIFRDLVRAIRAWVNSGHPNPEAVLRAICNDLSRNPIQPKTETEPQSGEVISMATRERLD